MDATHFDRLARALSDIASRRGFSRNLAVLTLAGILPSLLSPASTDAKRKKKKCKGKSKKCGKKCIPKTSCCSDSDCTGGQTCQSGACACPVGQDFCGGACVAACAAPSVRNPVTCNCCLPAGVSCGQMTDPPCCFTGGIGCVVVCDGSNEGQPCQFNAQCDPGLTCVSGTCTS